MLNWVSDVDPDLFITPPIVCVIGNAEASCLRSYGSNRYRNEYPNSATPNDINLAAKGHPGNSSEKKAK